MSEKQTNFGRDLAGIALFAAGALLGVSVVTGYVKGISADTVAGATRKILATMNGRRGYIFNLGHGLPPTAKIENIEQLVDIIHKFAWQN